MKRIIKIGVISLLVSMLCSCEDIFQVEYPVLNISFADTDRVDINGVMQAYTDEIVTIYFSGDMDILYQYDGTRGYEYLTDDEICTTGGEAIVQFGSILNHEPTLRQTDCLKLYISTDFTGVKDSININNATWVEIPEGHHNGFDKIGNTETFSDWVDLFDYIDDDSDYVYFGFRYKTQSAVDYGGDGSSELNYGPQWYVRYFDFRRTYEDGRSQYYGLYDPNVTDNDMRIHFVYAGFISGTDWNNWNDDGTVYTVDEYERSSSDGSSSNLNYWRFYTRSDDIYDYAYIGPKIYSTTYTYADMLADDDWLISREFDLKKAPANDYSTVLKGTTTDVPETSTVSYDTAGEYTISVIAKNLTIKHEKTVVKRLTIKITDPN